MGNSFSKNEEDAINATHSDQWSAAYKGDYGWFIKNKLDWTNGIDKKDNAGRTALYSAAKKGHINIVMYLVLNGANVNATATKGSTALHAAAYNGHGSVVQFLVAYGCNVGIQNDYGLTAAQEAKDEKVKNMILYPERGNTERFTIKKRDLPAFLDDDVSLYNSHRLEDITVACAKSLSKTEREKLIREMNKNYKFYASQLEDIMHANVETWYKKIIYLYTLESPLYKKMNADLAGLNLLSDHKMYANHLQRALKRAKLPKWKGKVCYRSMYLTEDQFAAIGKKRNLNHPSVSFQAFSSCTKSKSIALGWGGNTLLIIDVKQTSWAAPVDIEAISPFPEEEVLCGWRLNLEISIAKRTSYPNTNVKYEVRTILW